MSGGTPPDISGKADTVLTTNGDTLYYNNGRQRLSKGTDGQVLELSSGLPSWATVESGKMVLLDSHEATSTESTYTFTSTSSLDMENDYSELIVLISGNATASLSLQLIINAIEGVAYSQTTLVADSTSVTHSDLAGQGKIEILNTALLDNPRAILCELHITGNPFNRDLMINGNNYALGEGLNVLGGSMAENDGLIDSLRIKTSTSTWSSGTQIITYGVKR